MDTSCKRCGSKRWEYMDTITTVIDFYRKRLQASEITKTSLRCAECGHKATIVESEAIRATALFRPLTFTKDFDEHETIRPDADTVQRLHTSSSSHERRETCSAV